MDSVEKTNAFIFLLMKEIRDYPVEGFNNTSFVEYVSRIPTAGYSVEFKVDGETTLTLYFYVGTRGEVENEEQLFEEHSLALDGIGIEYPSADFGGGEVGFSEKIADTKLHFLISAVEYELQTEPMQSYLLTSGIFGFFCKARITHSKHSKIDLPFIIQRLSYLIDNSIEALYKKAS